MIQTKPLPWMTYYSRLYTNPSKTEYFSNARACYIASHPKTYNRVMNNPNLSDRDKRQRIDELSNSVSKNVMLKKELERLIKKNMPREYSFEGVEKMLEEHLTSENSAERFKAKELLLTHLSKITDLQLKHGYLREEDLSKTLSTTELLERHKLLTQELSEALQLPEGTDDVEVLPEGNKPLLEAPDGAPVNTNVLPEEPKSLEE